MKRIAIIDSGSGGINVLAKCIKSHPCFDYLLYLDDKNIPYGNKNVEELRYISKNVVTDILNLFHPDIIIIACNTLTCVALDYLKNLFPKIKFIGTYPNLEKIKSLNNYLILATKVTIQNSSILKSQLDHCFYPENLPKVIDENLFNREEIKKYLRENLPREKFEGIVLGCTHFEGIKEELNEIYDNPIYSEGSDSVVKELSRFAYGSSYKVQIISSREKFGEFFSYFSSLMSSNNPL